MACQVQFKYANQLFPLLTRRLQALKQNQKKRWISRQSQVLLYSVSCSNGDGLPTTVDTPVAVAAQSTLETSADAKWMADAATTLELQSQGGFTSLGLGGYSPVGLIQWSLEYIYIHTHLPWWAAIVTSTIVLRTVMFPIAVRVQANAARLNNIRPEMDKIMAKIRECNQAGNTTQAAQQTAKLLALYQKHKCHPFKMFIMPAVQIPVFLSFFIAIRRMAAVPVESMKSGGMLWFTDLTVPDPYYVLPALACMSFMAIIELGGEAGVSNPQTEKLKTFFRAMSILLIPVTATFPSGLFMYWLTASGFSISQILLLKVPRARAALNIPELIKHPSQGQKKEEGGLITTVKESYRSAVLIDHAKKRETEAKKKYERLKKDPNPKLYDEPPNRRGGE